MDAPGTSGDVDVDRSGAQHGSFGDRSGNAATSPVARSLRAVAISVAGMLLVTCVVVACAGSSATARATSHARAACNLWNSSPSGPPTIATMQAALSGATQEAAKAAQLDRRWDSLHAAMLDAEGRINAAVQYKQLGNDFGSIVAYGQVLRASPDLDTITSQCQVANA